MLGMPGMLGMLGMPGMVPSIATRREALAWKPSDSGLSQIAVTAPTMPGHTLFSPSASE